MCDLVSWEFENLQNLLLILLFTIFLLDRNPIVLMFYFQVKCLKKKEIQMIEKALKLSTQFRLEWSLLFQNEKYYPAGIYCSFRDLFRSYFWKQREIFWSPKKAILNLKRSNSGELFENLVLIGFILFPIIKFTKFLVLTQFANDEIDVQRTDLA